jgi:D-tyrosyl-tRNA(Tyr) deacylase
MRAVVQRVRRAAVAIDNRERAAIGPGLCVLLAAGPDDSEEVARHLAERVTTLRIFPDAAEKMNLDIHAAGGEVLVVSQFTLYADNSRGHRPSFIRAAEPERAGQLCRAFTDAIRARGLAAQTGEFGARMLVSIENDGPVTIVLSSGESPWVADAG